jgi:molecular chaperone DnaK
MPSRVVGIDLGTTFSAIASVNDHGRPEIIPNRDGEEITPSVVLFDGDAPIVGSIAKRSAVVNPLSVAQFVKRQMGVPTWSFRSESGSKYSAEEISAIILKKLKEDAELLLGGRIVDAVITVPAYFDDAQRKATQDSGRIAGLNVLRIINEPTAAALAYGLDKAKAEQTILVYDLGGGTFDVTIMRIGAGRIDVLATGGDKNLGGFDWDNQIMTLLNDEFKAAGGPDLFEDPTLEQDLRDKAEIAKRTLSTRERTAVFLSGGGKTATVELTLERFQEITRPLIERTGRIMQFVLEDSGLTWSQIEKILLVGGSTRMRAVPALVEAASANRPSCELHPDKVVAMGAAIQGALLHVETGKSSLVEMGNFPLVVIQDVNSHSMGVVTHDDRDKPHNSIVLKKNTPYGTRTEDVFATVRDGQQGIHVQVTEGEDEELSQVKIVGAKEMPIPPYPKGAPIRVSFLYTPDGFVRVEVFDMTTNTPLGELQIERVSNKTAEQVEASSRRLSDMSVS